MAKSNAKRMHAAALRAARRVTGADSDDAAIEAIAFDAMDAMDPIQRLTMLQLSGAAADRAADADAADMDMPEITVKFVRPKARK